MPYATRDPITNRLTNIRNGAKQYDNDVELVAIPEIPQDLADIRPYEYDAVNKLAVPISQPTYDSEVNAKARVDAVTNLSNIKAEFKLLRVLMLILLDELNLHAAKFNAILDAIDAGATLAQVKANIAAIANYPTRTAVQLRNAIQTKINNGDADN